MAFWIGWELWEKLSLVLAALIALVILYASCVLVYTRWMTRRYAAAEARQKEEEAEMYPMLIRDDIPFGARALERGMQVEGIWVSKPNTPIASPHQPGTPIESRPPSPALKPIPIRPVLPATSPAPENTVTNRSFLPPYTRAPMPSEVEIVTGDRCTYEPQRPGGIYSPMVASSIPNSPSTFHPRSDTFAGNEKRTSFHSRIRRASQLFDTRVRAGPNNHDEAGLDTASNGVGARPSAEQHRASRITRTLRRRSSEEFRRKMSAIFNERIDMNVLPEELQFSPTLREEQRRSLRKSILGPFRS